MHSKRSIPKTTSAKRPHDQFDEFTVTALLEAVRKATPDEDGVIGYIGNEPVFRLAQYLQGVVSKNTPLKELKPYVKCWYDLSAKYLDDMSFAQVWSLFIELWPKVKYAKRDALTIAVARARTAAYKMPELHWCEDKRVLLLARVCWELSRPDGAFFLSSYDAGSIMGMDQKTGLATLKMLQAEGIIRIIRKGCLGRSSSYIYTGQPPIPDAAH